MKPLIDTALIRRAIEKNNITFNGKRRLIPNSEKVTAAAQTLSKQEKTFIFLPSHKDSEYRTLEPVDFSRRTYVKKIRKGCSGFFHPDLMNAR